MLRMRADLQFAAGRHSAALSFYLESVAVKTDFFQVLHIFFLSCCWSLYVDILWFVLLTFTCIF